MNHAAYVLANFAGAVAWVFGISFAQGFWSTAAAAVFPPYAWVLVADRLSDEPKCGQTE